VLRDGHLQQVPAAELVPGDIVELTGALQMCYNCVTQVGSSKISSARQPNLTYPMRLAAGV
jgi:hypothetical protein